MLFRSDIPVGCGLGSSAAAIVAGALLADQALELGLARTRILEIGTAIEGHPDNVAPAICGGAVLSVQTPKGLVASSLRVSPAIELLIAVPPAVRGSFSSRPTFAAGWIPGENAPGWYSDPPRRWIAPPPLVGDRRHCETRVRPTASRTG